MRAYEYRHIVGFAETNLIGNVYYVHHLHWQGRCRELFLRDMAPEVLAELAKDLRLVTTRCTCEYFQELHALEEVIVRMRLGSLMQNRITMEFEYYRGKDGKEDAHEWGGKDVFETPFNSVSKTKADLLITWWENMQTLTLTPDRCRHPAR